MLKATEPVKEETEITQFMSSAAADLKAGRISPREAIKRLGDAIEESFGPLEPLTMDELAEMVKEAPNERT